MGYEVHLSDEAQIELDVVECFFRSKNLHNAFLTYFFKQVDYLEVHPESFQIKYRNIRILCFDDFNYSIHYIIRSKEVLILRILNQQQNF